MQFHKKNKFFSGIGMFIEWFQHIREDFDDWNVVVMGLYGIKQIENDLGLEAYGKFETTHCVRLCGRGCN